MSEWKETPFATLEGAHQTAIKFGLNPSAIIDTGQGLRSFQTRAGRQVTLLAQRSSGGPVLEKRLPKGKKSEASLQDPNAPSFSEEDRLLTGPWTDSDHATLDAVRAHYQQLGPATKHHIAFVGELMVVEYPDGDVVEYRRASAGGRVKQRSLFSTKGRNLKPYEKVEFKVGAWAAVGPEGATLETVEAYWRKQFVNFDNVEVLAVTLYRIGRDEYEYVVDRNTGEAWCRVLSEVK